MTAINVIGYIVTLALIGGIVYYVGVKKGLFDVFKDVYEKIARKISDK